MREAGFPKTVLGAAPTAAGAETHLEAHLEVRDPRLWRALLLGGGLGAADAWADGWWDSPDPLSLLRLLARNRESLERLEGGLARLGGAAARLAHLARPNTRQGARRNVAAHYDLGNEFFALFLDPTMTYSCAWFEHPEATLEEAQLAKIDRLCRKLALTPDDHLLEIGTGWGSLAIRAASRWGCRVTTTTISAAQHEEAVRRVEAAGLADRVEVLRRDFRDLEGRYSKIVSVEMLEAIGPRLLPELFAVCERLLEPDGLVAIQAITIADRHYDRASRSVDFIQQRVFPGAALPSVGSLAGAVARGGGLTILHLEELGLHYAETLARWRRALEDRRPEALAQGLSERFLRQWSYYFLYCEAGFRERLVGDVQVLLAGRSFRGETAKGSL